MIRVFAAQTKNGGLEARRLATTWNAG